MRIPVTKYRAQLAQCDLVSSFLRIGAGWSSKFAGIPGSVPPSRNIGIRLNAQNYGNKLRNYANPHFCGAPDEDFRPTLVVNSAMASFDSSSTDCELADERFCQELTPEGFEENEQRS
jgi:hypothetical protein